MRENEFRSKSAASGIGNTPPATRLLGEEGGGKTVEQVPLPEFKDAPVVKRSIRKSKPKIQREAKIVPQKELCVNLCVNNFGKIGWEPGSRVVESVREIGSTH